MGGRKDKERKGRKRKKGRKKLKTEFHRESRISGSLTAFGVMQILLSPFCISHVDLTFWISENEGSTIKHFI